MGNILGTQPQPNIPFVPNIPLNNGNQNDVNRPHSLQIRDMILNFGVPLFYMAAYAVREYRNGRDTDVLQEQRDDIEDLNHQLTTAKNKLQELRKQQDHPAVLESLQPIEEEENLKYRKHLENLRYYENGLETILDVRCSMFKQKEQRHVIEDDLVNSLSENRLGHVIKYSQLKEIYQHDHKFCGSNRKENGKLRHLYVEQWKNKLELERHQNILRRVKDRYGTDENV